MPQLAPRPEGSRVYLNSIAATLELVVTERVTPLREPLAVRPEKAFQIIGLVVETIAGFAIGSVAGELARGVRRWFGAEGETLATFVRSHVPPGPRARPFAIACRFLADAETRPLVDELGARLQPRLRLATTEIRALVEGIVERVADPSAMFDRLIAESMFGDQLAETIDHGWRCACAAIEDAPMPELAGSSRSRALWHAWSELAGMSKPAPASGALEAAGYITLVR